MQSRTKKKKNVLILTTHPEAKGGITNYFNLFEKYFSSDTIDIDLFFIGKKVYNPSPAFVVYYTVTDFLKILWITRRYDLVHLNPTLGPKAVIRDGTYHMIAKRLYGKKTLVFFRGWFPDTEQAIEKKYMKLFKFAFNFDLSLVLGSIIKETLIRWGYPDEKIILETTAFESAQIPEAHHNQMGTPVTLVFLARIEQDKGVLEAVQTVEVLKKNHPSIMLNIIGDGNFLTQVQEYITQHNLCENVSLLGRRDGRQKYEVLTASDIMILPSYTEGMPNAVLEAMAVGLPIVSRPIGGMPDIIKDNENGFLINSLDPNDFARAVERLISDRDLYNNISRTNKKTAFERFEIKTVLKRIEQIYLRLLQ